MSAIIILRLRVLAAGALLAVAAAPLDCKQTAQAQESGGKRRQSVAEGSGAATDCSPYPFDIMAIHALRQSVG